MKFILTGLSAIASTILLVFLIGGCISIPDSPSPRFYALEAGPEQPDAGKLPGISGVLIGVGPVKVPGYQDRPQIVTQGQDKLVKFSQFERWGEALGVGIARLVREGLIVKLAGAKVVAFPWDLSVPVKYQVSVEIVRLNSDLDGDVFLVAQWMVVDARNTKTLLIKRSEFRHPVIQKNYPGVVEALSMVCTSLSGEIAQALVVLENSSPVIPRYN